MHLEGVCPELEGRIESIILILVICKAIALHNNRREARDIILDVRDARITRILVAARNPEEILYITHHIVVRKKTLVAIIGCIEMLHCNIVESVVINVVRNIHNIIFGNSATFLLETDHNSAGHFL